MKNLSGRRKKTLEKSYLKEAEEVLSELKSTPEGLTSEEANARLSRDGKNKL